MKPPKVKAPSMPSPIRPLVRDSNMVHKDYLASVSPKVESIINNLFEINTTKMPQVKTAFVHEIDKIAKKKKDRKKTFREAAAFAVKGSIPMLAGYGAGMVAGDFIAPKAYEMFTKKPLKLSPRAKMAMGVLSAMGFGGANYLRLKKNSEKKNDKSKRKKHRRTNLKNPAILPNNEPLAERHKGYSTKVSPRSLRSADFGGVQVRSRKGPIYDRDSGGGDGDNNNRRDDSEYRYSRKAPRYYRYS